MWFFASAWKLAMTDLMQGPVYGIDTAETRENPDLRLYFDYDHIFGIVIKRFVVQAAAPGYLLTVYGNGVQIRAISNFNDTLQFVAVDHVKKQRTEGEWHYYNPAYSALDSLDVKRHSLEESNIFGMISTVLQFRDNIETMWHKICFVYVIDRESKIWRKYEYA